MSRNKKRAAVASAVAFGLVAAGAFAAVSANADPTPGTFSPVVVVGSNTTQAFYGGLSQGFSFGGKTFVPNKIEGDIASYDATGTSQITTVSGGTAFLRPNGSGQGRSALSAAWNSTNHIWTANSTTTGLVNGDVTISRSSSRPGATKVAETAANNDETFIPFARDAVGVAADGLPGVPDLSTGQLEAIYGGGAGGSASATGLFTQVADTHTVGDIVRDTSSATAEPAIVTAVAAGVVTASTTISPILPQTSSGTRSSFLASVGATNTVFGSWVDSNGSTVDTDPTNAREENDVSYLSAGEIEPFSGAALIAEENGLAEDTGVNDAGITYPTINGQALDNGETGTAAGIATSDPLQGSNTGVVTQPTGTLGDFRRDLYTVVPSSNLGNKVGNTQVTLATLADSVFPSAVLGTKKVVADYGFLPLPSTTVGSTPAYTTNHSNWFFSSWEN